MKKIVYIAAVVLFAVSFTSCGTTSMLEKESNEVAGYTLKNKKELFQQKVLHSKPKTVIAIP